VGAVIAFGRWQGIRSLIGLGLSFVVIVGFVVPAILHGHSPVLVAVTGAMAIMLLSLYLSHGTGPKTTVAVVGTALALGMAALVAGALRVGRDHIAATVNTLLLAYAGAALPLLILFVTGRDSLGTVATTEIVAVEVVRALCGSVGLIAAVPLTTILAALVATEEPSPGHSHPIAGAWDIPEAEGVRPADLTAAVPHGRSGGVWRAA
jgi:uncharacterized membrane protein